MINNAVIAVAINEALATARFAAAADFTQWEGDEGARQTVALGVELAAVALAHALDLKPGSDARVAFMTACGVRSPKSQ